MSFQPLGVANKMELRGIRFLGAAIKKEVSIQEPEDSGDELKRRRYRPVGGVDLKNFVKA
jgi:hypothetical protein